MARLNANTVLSRPDTLEVITLAAGEDVPDWADGLVGEHLIDDEPEKPKRAPARKAAAKTDEG